MQTWSVTPWAGSTAQAASSVGTPSPLTLVERLEGHQHSRDTLFEALPAECTGRQNVLSMWVTRASRRALFSHQAYSGDMQITQTALAFRADLLDLQNEMTHALSCHVQSVVELSCCLSADARPFDYMMNNIVEARVYDPDGSYVRRWLPALARLPVKYIHK